MLGGELEMTHSRPRRSRFAGALLAGLAACTAHVSPVPSAPTTPPVAVENTAPAAPPVAVPAPAAPREDRTVINFEEDTGGAMPSGPELDVVDSKPRAKFRSLIDPKYRRDAGASVHDSGK
jgi:hypothetical protein